jgi:predicted enzyme related to lactoylglutathione lyase
MRCSVPGGAATNLTAHVLGEPGDRVARYVQVPGVTRTAVPPPLSYGANMETPRLTHVRVNVSDLNAAIGWYERIFGIAASGHWPPENPTYAHFTLGPAQFALGQYEPTPSTGVRFNFAVDHVEAWWARLGQDAEVIEPLFDTPYGTRKFTIRDPDGNELGFVQD